jgi:phosphohistidine swiveling domain-containing protein
VTSMQIVPLHAAFEPQVYGDKAANLARVSASGLRIPDGVALPALLLDQHLERCGLGDALSTLAAALDRAGEAAWSHHAEAIRTAVVATPLDPALAEVLAALSQRWPQRRLAVRSSACGEDSREHSFAGQLDTLLDVASGIGLCDAVRQIWASLWSERCLAYQQRRGVRLRALGVIVCEQIDARISGVLFTRPPAACASPSDTMLMEYCDGLGDKLVNGHAAPGTLVLSRREGTVIVDTPPPEASSGLSSYPAQLDALRQGAIALERAFALPLDIEWTISRAGTLWFLQARPITTGAPRVVWSNANIAENFPDPVSPMLYSIARAGYTAYFRNLGLGFGISRKRIDAMQDALENIIGVHAGRLYYNLTNIHTLLGLAPGGRWLTGFFNQFTGARDFPQQQELPRLGLLGRVLEALRIPLLVCAKYLTVKQRVARFERAVDAFCARFPPETLATQPLTTLRQAVREFLDIRLHRWNDAALADTAAMVSYGLLQLAVRHAFSGDDEEAFHNTLLKGLPDLASHAPVTRLWALSRELRAEPALRAQIEHCSAPQFMAVLDHPEHAAFARSFLEYLDRFGFRSSRELMLTVPTPPERPEETVALLKLYAALDGPSPDALLANQVVERLALTRALEERLTPLRALRALPLASRAARFRLLLRAAQGSIGLRERARFRQALLYTRLRRILLAIGDRLTERGALINPEDVFYLEVGELDALLAGSAMFPHGVADLVAGRMQAHARFMQLSLPETLRLPPGEYLKDQDCAMATARVTPADALRGISACGGTYRGRAAVLADATEAGRLTADGLLVTRQTDPGWATVFFLVRGLVVERGGMLSHGAIIAREYGIPAVVGVPGAMQLIREGDDVSVDGDRGIVTIYRG